MKKILATLFATLAVSAFAGDLKMTVVFNSDPQGQRVFVGYTADLSRNYAKEFLGITPCTNTVICGSHNTVYVRARISGMSSWVPPLMVFSCEPAHAETNLFMQTVILHGEAHFHDPEVIPSSLFFDMYKQPKPEKSDKADKEAKQ